MSQENVTIVRRLWEALNDRGVEDLAAVLDEFFDPEIEWHDAPSFPGAAVYRGHQALRGHIEDYLEAWADSRFEIEDLRAVGDRVLTRGRYVGVGRESGIGLEDNLVLGVYELRRGRVLRIQQFVDEAEALAAVGLSEQATSQEDRPRVSRQRFEAFMEAVNARDFDALSEVATTRLGFHSILGGTEGAEPYTGVQGMREWAKEVDAVWEDWHQEVVEFRQVSDRQAVITVRATGRAKASGVPLDSLTGNVLTWHEDSGWEMVAYTDPREALEAVGLAE